MPCSVGLELFILDISYTIFFIFVHSYVIKVWWRQYFYWRVWVVVQKAQNSDFPCIAAASKIKKSINDGDPQISTAANKVDYPHQEESDGALKLPSTQEPELKVGALIAREE